jgi:hypothetical protein
MCQLVKIPFMVAALALAYNSSAQKNNAAPSSMVWKKQVERIVEIPPAEPGTHHLKDAGWDNNLLTMLINAIQSGKVTAYSNWDNRFSEVLTREKMHSLFANDTVEEEVEDPVSGQERKVYRVKEFHPENIKKFRTLEDWTFNPGTGHTDIQIVGISPVNEIYGDDGSFRGVQAIFWVKFNDIKSILEQDAQYHPKTSLVSRIWDDYFQSDTKPAAHK